MGSNLPSRPPPSIEVSAHDIQLLADRRAIDERRRGIERVLSQLGVPRKEHDDLVQTVMLRATEARDRYDPALGTVQSWVEGIARNAVREHRRQYRRKHALLVPESDVPSVEPQAPGLNPEQIVHTRRTLGALKKATPRPVEPVLTMYAEGHTRAEIMEETGVSAGKLACSLRRLAAARDKVVRAMREKRKTVLGVRFCFLPWWLFALREEESTGTHCKPEPGASPDRDPHPDRHAGVPRMPPWPRRIWPRAAAAAATTAMFTLATPLGLAASSDSWVTTALGDASTSPSGLPASTPPLLGQPPPELSLLGQPPPGRLIAGEPPPRKKATPAVSAAPYRLLRLASQATHSGALDVADASLAEHARRHGAAATAERAQLAHAARLAGPR